MTHRLFWREHPALLLSLTLLIAIGAALFWQGPWNWIFPILWCLYLFFLKKWPALLLLPAGFAYCHFLYQHQPPPGPASGIFSISTLQPHQSPFARGFVYKGKLTTSNGSAACDLYTQGWEPPFEADCDYFLNGKLEQMGPYHYTFKPKEWTRIETSWSLAHWRYLAKERYRQFLKKKCPHPRSAQFLSALTTGDVDDRLLKYEFGKLGLQHLLAISGFHFGILIAFASFALSLFLPRIPKLIFLLLCLNAYYFFVGPFPGVQRTWLTAILYLLGKLFKRQTSALNLLGFTLGFEIISNPLIASNLGFQFSFASTAGILLLYPLCEKKLSLLLPKRPPQLALSFLSRHFYLLSSFLRSALALTFAVNAAILPILLVHFHLFPLLSLLYNLFFPLAVGIALSSLLLALAFQFLIPSLASPLFTATSWFTSKLLDLAAYPPSALDYPLMVPNFPALAIPFCLFFLLSLSIKNKMSKENHLI